MIRFDLNIPRERELFAQMVAELQEAGAAYEVEQCSHSHAVTLYFLTKKGGERI